MKSARILIVEDEQLVAADLAAKLGRLGHTVVGQAASGPEAIQIAQRELPDLVLMDIRLQGSMDGLEAAKRLVAIMPAKVIFVSAFGQLSRQACEDEPARACITKPFSRLELQAALATALQSNE